MVNTTKKQFGKFFFDSRVQQLEQLSIDLQRNQFRLISFEKKIYLLTYLSRHFIVDCKFFTWLQLQKYKNAVVDNPTVKKTVVVRSALPQ